jgi:type VI secretion system secreted protein Hcp
MKKLISYLVALLLVIGLSQAAAYIKFDGVEGEAQDKDHMGWSDLLSFSQGLHQPGGGATGPTRRRGDVILDDVQVTKELDKASPKLAESVCKGKMYPKVEIHLDRVLPNGSNLVYYKYELTNARVVSYYIGWGYASPDFYDETTYYYGYRPVEEFSINFEEIKVTYSVCDDEGICAGNIEYSWKVEEGES